MKVRIPKKLPAWVIPLLDHLVEKELLTKNAQKGLKRSIAKEWEAFVAERGIPPAPRDPSKSRATKKKDEAAEAMRSPDPTADLSKAVKGYREALAEEVPARRPSGPVVEAFKEQIRKLPEPLRCALREEYASGGGGEGVPPTPRMSGDRRSAGGCGEGDDEDGAGGTLSGADRWAKGRGSEQTPCTDGDATSGGYPDDDAPGPGEEEEEDEDVDALLECFLQEAGKLGVTDRNDPVVVPVESLYRVAKRSVSPMAAETLVEACG